MPVELAFIISLNLISLNLKHDLVVLVCYFNKCLSIIMLFRVFSSLFISCVFALKVLKRTRRFVIHGYYY